MDRETVRKIARLARLHVSEDETAALGADLDRILDYVKRLQAVEISEDLEGPEPAIEEPLESLLLRDDEVVEGFTPEQATRNAPDAEDGFFRVPRVIG